jgi:hypothetical protein
MLLALLASAAAISAEFETIDTNDDGRVSSSEYEVYTRLVFDEIDGDGDDKLTNSEIMASESKFNRHVFTTGHILGPAKLTTAERIQRLDANKNGTIEQSEHADGAAAKFQKMDIDHGGELSQQEFAAGG